MIRSTLLILALSLAPAFGQAPEWGQCGGIGWTGATSPFEWNTAHSPSPLMSIFSLRFGNELPDHQCVLLSVLARSCDDHGIDYRRSAADQHQQRADLDCLCSRTNGFRKNIWDKVHPQWRAIHAFWVRFIVSSVVLTHIPSGSSNAYWLALGGYSTTDINKAFSDIAASGATTVRYFRIASKFIPSIDIIAIHRTW